MIIAKIFRHRHKDLHYDNDDLKEVLISEHWKIIFSRVSEMNKFKAWVEEYGGNYDFNKEKNKQEGEVPDLKHIFGDEAFCWCDSMTHYLMEIEGYKFHGTTNPYKGEIYYKDEPEKY